MEDRPQNIEYFDFLGFNISADGLKVAERSVRNFVERIAMKLSDCKDSYSEAYLFSNAVTAYG